MAGKPKSKRQIAYESLDNMAGVPRQEAAKALVDHLGISPTYAMTLFQSHRQERSKESSTGNGFVTIFKVRDTKSNAPVDPYMSSMVRNNPGVREPRNREEAIEQYRADNTRKSKLALKL